jgi:hypothetical protein
MTDAIDLGDPSAWCDSRCDRCPLLEGCQVGRRIADRFGNCRGDGRDPQEWQIALADITRELERAMALAAAQADRHGIDWSSTDEPPGDPSVADEAEDLGIVLVDAANELTAGEGEEEEPAEAVVAAACLLSTKVARVAREAGHPALDDDRRGSEAILLLIEHTWRSLDAAAGHFSRRPKRFARFKWARAALWRLVGPWLRGVSAETRRTLAAMIEAGRAPSPFCSRLRPASPPAPRTPPPRRGRFHS